ncbi:hypothetical protein HNP46_000336 [Pseudomonas nitritireducens]|uniref:DUF5983 domain-containing protein n=1 Tax=Pseudomonas nitroreducens TaxID=46680 RepID=A0A7W7KFG0_PSENT|nr:hypothetical protein [Pseudomonas nitritireducens]MBB4861525.1 hypothetical protein [Pseudomonas nitritireducens]
MPAHRSLSADLCSSISEIEFDYLLKASMDAHNAPMETVVDVLAYGGEFLGVRVLVPDPELIQDAAPPKDFPNIHNLLRMACADECRYLILEWNSDEDDEDGLLAPVAAFPQWEAPKFKLTPEGKYEIQKCLVLSTCHVTEAEMTAVAMIPVRNNSDMENPEGHKLIVHPVGTVAGDRAYGSLVYAGNLGDSDDVSSGVCPTTFPNVLRLLELARQNDCCWLKLDRDGNTYEELPLFDW